MSGGSFEYLYARDAPSPEELDSIADALEEVRPSVAATQTRGYASFLRILRDDEALREVWRTVEWWKSNDYGIDQVEEAISAYESQEVN